MPYIFAALGLMIVHALGAFFAIRLVPGIADYEDIARICNVAGLGLADCRQGAASVALVSVACLAAVGLVTWVLDRSTGKRAAEGRPLDTAWSRWLALGLLTALTVVLVLHNIERAGASGSSTVRVPPRESAFISLENLCWPLLLQLLAWTRVTAMKATIVAFIGAVIALSPFRAVLFAAAFFGAVVPLAARARRERAARNRVGRTVLIGLASVAALGSAAIVYQTDARRLQATATAGLVDALVSRAASPFFQGELARQVASMQQRALPTFIDTMASKFQRGAVINLNQRLYAMLYESQAEGQTTSMLVGEAAANTRLSPAFWVFSAPIFLILFHLASRRWLDLQVLIGVALWRCSMGGLFDVLPALALQIGFCALLGWNGRIGPWRREVAT